MNTVRRRAITNYIYPVNMFWLLLLSIHRKWKRSTGIYSVGCFFHRQRQKTTYSRHMTPDFPSITKNVQSSYNVSDGCAKHAVVCFFLTYQPARRREICIEALDCVIINILRKASPFSQKAQVVWHPSKNPRYYHVKFPQLKFEPGCG